MGRMIHCPICGLQTSMSAYSTNRRESGTCRGCGSFNRQRQLAIVLLDAVAPLLGDRPTSLTAFVTHPGAADVRIHSTEIGGAVHRVLQSHAGYSCSEYCGPDVESGTVVDGVRHEDLLATSFDDATIDVLLSADVLEHIPEPYEAHREIHRILRPGGRHVFTVPSHMGMPHDSQRAALVDGEVQWFAPPEYHGAETEALLVYTVFGAEMLDHLRALGFDPLVRDLHEPDHGCDGPGAVVYDVVRVTDPTGAEVPAGLRLDRIPQPEPPTGDRGEMETAAFVELEQGAVETALAGFLECSDRYGPGPWCLIGVADCALLLGDRTSAAEVLTMTLEHWPWRWDARARLERVEELLV